ncbi:CUB domain-containing protein [Levilactobacillus enshiensis]|uniref:hypothetical protein n=1 Tax=Levilactobacillus enshiensis TaxID=2590213 RepID=UPI00117AD595|nr:hypothetical protein [Levilactobacillus enshiensis]
MGLFDLGNKTKAYKRATTNTAEVDKEKIDELTQALKTTEDNLVGGLGLLQDDVSDVSDILASDAKEKLLGLVQKLSFKENLDDTSKAFMVATLVTLGHEIGDTSDLQKHYLRAISRYLEVSPTDGADIYGIENITDAETSQLIFRAVNEYLFLYNGTRNLVRSNQKITDYFDCFNINNRTKEKVIADIQDRISVMGNEGLIIPFEVTDEKINAQTAENIATAEAKSEGEDSRTNGKDDVEDDIYAKQKMVGNILEPIKYFQGYYISIFPKVDIVKAREICGYDYLNVEKDNIIGVLCGSGDDGIFGSLSHRIGVVFLKDRVISNRQTYGHVTKKHVKFNVTLYQDLKIEEKPDKSYVAYNGINWNVGSPKQADKMVAVLNELKEKASQIMAGTLVESRQVNDENSQGTLEGLAKIISPIQGFKEEITSVYPQADLSKANYWVSVHGC